MESWAQISSLEITSEESLSELWALLSNPSRVAAARNLQGDEAQTFIDFLDKVLGQPRLDDKLRHRSLLLLSKICKAHTIVPSSYVLQEELLHVGRLCRHGGFAEVSNGEYMGCPVAIKYLKTNEEDANRTFKRLCREIIGWKHLSHPNILPLLGVSVSMDPYCFRILTRWMINGNITEYARSNPEVNRLQLLLEVASGVAYLHELGIVHGDLKGANILVDDDGIARLADFGLMTILIENSTFPLSATAVSSVGTVCWMSPELLIGEGSTPTRQSDCYALGMVVYEVLTGLRPFYHLGTYAVVIAVQKGERPKRPPNARSLGFSDVLWGLTVRCWSKSSTARPTAQALLDCLQDASHIWVPPPEYPIPAVGAGLQITYDNEWNTVTGTRARSLFVLVVGMLCVLVFPFARANRTPVI
ncbi:kinase-like domain-containing protein [Thelephora terrestris]|uniref:Kinase-like domain-containing protein n=1 Tax=Thelephora terrestris TaxID=56493 RepID=A0A9P6L6T5_9AGAM|nr:kinase-like domain-containing protein [Thelephora terrestris]